MTKPKKSRRKEEKKDKSSRNSSVKSSAKSSTKSMSSSKRTYAKPPDAKKPDASRMQDGRWTDRQESDKKSVTTTTEHERAVASNTDQQSLLECTPVDNQTALRRDALQSNLRGVSEIGEYDLVATQERARLLGELVPPYEVTPPMCMFVENGRLVDVRNVPPPSMEPTSTPIYIQPAFAEHRFNYGNDWRNRLPSQPDYTNNGMAPSGLPPTSRLLVPHIPLPRLPTGELSRNALPSASAQRQPMIDSRVVDRRNDRRTAKNQNEGGMCSAFYDNSGK